VVRVRFWVEFLIACNGFRVRVRVCYDVVGGLAYYIITHWTHRPLPEMCCILFL